MSTSRVGRSESVDNTCPVCHDLIDKFAIGPCDHPVCSRCSTRMRVLCEQMDCPICRSQMPQVAYVYNKSLFKDISLRDCIPNRKYKIFFEDKDVEDSFLDLLEFRCPMTSCQNRSPDRSFAVLQTHMRRDHQLFACDLCVLHLKIFPFERKFYNRKSLAIHRRVGDEDDKSYKGHPLCEFCDIRYNDKDELLKHLRKDHFFCHYCDQQGSNAYYDQYPDLMKHFSETHFLCTEGDCGNPSTRFTHAFVSEIDLKAHRASAHNKNLSKAQSREARTIDVDFQLPRRRPGHRGDDFEETRSAQGGRSDRYNRRRDYDPEDAELQRAIEASKDPARTETGAVFKESVPDPVADFPALNGVIVPASMPSVQKTIAAPVEDFPSLSASRSSKQQTQPPAKAYSSVMNLQVDVKPTVPIHRESKPVSLGTVGKMYREHQSSAPRNTEDEYPSLGGTSPQNLMSNSSSGNWIKKSKNGNVVANSATNTNFKSHTNDKPKSLQNERSLIKDENQFPKLPAGGQQKSKDAKHFPDWIKQNGASDKQKQKAEKSYDQSFELPDSYRHLYEGSTPVEKSVNIVKTIATAVVVEKPSKPAAINNPEEFPGLPVRITKTKNKDDSKKKKKIKKEDNVKTKVSDETNACLGEIALTLMQPGKDSGKVSTASSESKLMNRNSRPSKILDWFDNPPAPSEDSQQRSSKIFEDITPKKNDTPPLPVEDSSNFPSLHSMSISIQQPKPPPGFTSYPQPPNLTPLSAPPGFEKQPPTLSIPPTPVFSFNVSYTQPTDFRPRNLKLIEDIRQALATVEEGFSNFKVLSSQFRQGLIDASNYYLSCLALMGDKEFPKVFPELLALLPDIKKQRELWEVQQAQNKKFNTVNPNKLSDCQICGQLMVAEDVYYHQLQHASSTDFPLLSVVSGSKIPSSNGMGPDMQIKESWIRAK